MSAFGRFLLPVLLFFAVSARAETTVDDAGRFAADIPGPIQRSSQSVPTTLGAITMHMVFHDGGATAFLVMFNDYPAGSMARSDLGKVYDGGINGAVQNVKGTARGICHYQLGGVDGREFFVDMPAKAAAHIRFFIVGDRFYQVMYVGPAGQENSPGALAFLNSFRLLR
jgi:hypothetical protein